MNNALEQLAKLVADAKVAGKAKASAAREAAPKGTKVAHGQHAQAQVAATIGQAIAQKAPSLGYVIAGGSVRRDKAGAVKELTVTYRPTVSLEQRIATYQNAAARRKAKRDAEKATPTANVTPLPSAAAPDATADLAALASKLAA